MAWIGTISYADSGGRLRKLYDRIKGPENDVDNIMMMHSLRPHSMEGHMGLYKNVLHHTGNSVEKWFLETIGVWVSRLNRCAYCADHHFEGLKRILNDDRKAAAIDAALDVGDIETGPFSAREQLALRYAEALTRDPPSIGEDVIKAMRAAGYDDGEILEINQVTAYFAYANRTVLGLGCSSEGDVLGLSPNESDSPDDWSHK